MVEKGDKGDKGSSALFPWVILVIVFVIMGVTLTRNYTKTNQLNKENHSSIIELQRTKANVHQLQKSNCTLRIFLATARFARFSALKAENPQKQKVDRRAIISYTKLIDALDGESYCPMPKNLVIPKERDG